MPRPCGSGATAAEGWEAGPGKTGKVPLTSDTVARMDQAQARKAAEERLQQQAGFKKMIGGFLILIVVAVAIWAITGQGYFWPIWLVFGLGIATAFSAWSAYGPRDKGPSQAEIDEEARKYEDG